MSMLLELSEGLSAHPMGRTVRQHRARFLFEGNELRFQGVVFTVGNQRRILHVVGAGIRVEPIDQLLHSLQLIVFHDLQSIIPIG